MRILVIEDNPKMAESIQRGVAEHGYAADVCHGGFEGERLAAEGTYDLIVLDLMLPDREGLDVCRSLRRRALMTPILVLTALAATAQTVAGFEAGADGYLAKPFEFDELIARIRSLLRRGKATESARLIYDDLELNLSQRTATRAGTILDLSGREFALLEYLVRNPDRVLPRQVIAEKVWERDCEPSSNVLNVYICSLRHKIDDGSPRPLIHTIFGTGYRFGAPDPHPAPG